MILGEDNRKAWSQLDVLVMQAYQIVEDERCGQCGLPRWLCRNEDGRLDLKIRYDDCYATNEIRKAEKDRKEDDTRGVAYPEFVALDGTPLVEFRALYYQQLAEERAEAEAEEEDD